MGWTPPASVAVSSSDESRRGWLGDHARCCRTCDCERISWSDNEMSSSVSECKSGSGTSSGASKYRALPSTFRSSVFFRRCGWSPSFPVTVSGFRLRDDRLGVEPGAGD